MTEHANVEPEKYLIFSVSDALYATILGDVNEVVESQKAKPMPNMVDHFEGLINIRGEVVGVINLLKKLNIQNNEVKQKAAMIFHNDSGVFAVNIDKTVGICSIEEGQIERRPSLSTQVPMKYLAGVIKKDSDLIPIIELNKLLSDDCYVSFRNSKFSE